jgi:hypothetical protein
MCLAAVARHVPQTCVIRRFHFDSSRPRGPSPFDAVRGELHFSLKSRRSARNDISRRACGKGDPSRKRSPEKKNGRPRFPGIFLGEGGLIIETVPSKYETIFPLALPSKNLISH